MDVWWMRCKSFFGLGTTCVKKSNNYMFPSNFILAANCVRCIDVHLNKQSRSRHLQHFRWSELDRFFQKIKFRWCSFHTTFKAHKNFRPAAPATMEEPHRRRSRSQLRRSQQIARMQHNREKMRCRKQISPPENGHRHLHQQPITTIPQQKESRQNTNKRPSTKVKPNSKRFFCR